MKIEIGSKIPEFTLKDQNGKSFNINQVLGSKTLVLFFYPKDDSPGCTKEACAFRDEYERFKEIGAEVIGISSDSTASHKKFSENLRLPFTLLSDEKGNIRNLLKVPTNFLGLLPGRVTYIIDKSGVVQYIFNSQLNFEKHVTQALDVIKSLE